MKLWKRYWTNENETLKSLSQIISVINENQMGKMFPCVMRVFEILLVIPATSARVERSNSVLILFRMGFFGTAHEWGAKKSPPPNLKICHTYPTLMKLGTVVPCLKKIQKYINHVAHLLSSADTSIFSPKISNFCYIRKYSYRLHFNEWFLDFLTSFWVFKCCFDKYWRIFDDVSKIGYSRSC